MTNHEHASSGPRWRDGTHSACDSSSHRVQFCNDENVLVDTAVQFIGAALLAGEGAMVLAIQAHRQRIEARLGVLGIDLRLARKDGRYVAIDAADVVAPVMVNGLPNRDRFVATLGVATARMTATARVSAFGEMAPLLWASGNGKAAIAFEELVQKELVEKYPLSVHCPYVVDLGTDAAREHFVGVCAAHNAIRHSPNYFGSADLLATESGIN